MLSLHLVAGSLLIIVLVTSPQSAAKSMLQVDRQISSIAGVVADQNGDPITGAVVALDSATLHLQTKTDDSGRFRFGLTLVTTMTLIIEAEGFAQFKQKLNLQTDDKTQLHITLKPVPISERVTVTATRTDMRLSDTAASVAVLRADDLQATAAVTIDDALRQVPGFSLFRRSGSRTANPTSQGVSIRGLGASGTSRAIVLSDNVPLNDPFGGWVYWARIPAESIKQIEVLQGAASDLYGSAALGGAVNMVTKVADANAVTFEASYGNQLTSDAGIYFSRRMKSWAVSVGAESFRTDGYILVDENERGRVDTEAASRHSTVNLRLQHSFGENKTLFGGASFYGESRKNGTPLTPNRTHVRQFIFGSDWQTGDLGLFTARIYGGTQVLDQNFSAVSADRNTETLTRIQRVPVQVFGLTSQWSRAFGKSNTLVAGFEANQVRGASDEIAFTAGRATSLIGAGGRQATFAGYFQDLIRIKSQFFLTVRARIDQWRNYDALSGTQPLIAGSSTTIAFPDRSESAFSPGLSVLYKFTTHIAVTGGISRAFRGPTLNELYRSFRVGNVMTLANSNLRSERLTNGEAGIRTYSLKERLVVRGTFFWAVVSEPVANVTLSTTPALITRQRQNLGKTRSRGIEVAADLELAKHWSVTGGFLFADATVLKFPANTSLEGLMIPQVPRHQFTLQLRYANPSVATVGFQARASSAQFDDDQNLFRLGPYFTLDLYASRRIAKHVDTFVAIENLFNQRYEIGKTPVTTLGPPLLLRAGLRVDLSK